MPTTIAEIEERIRTLSRAERADLIRSLLAELDGPAERDVDIAWIEEAKRRHEQLADGSIKGVPAQEVFARLSARLRR
jgi:Arc/MetJ-type ribon-helix-helix transcriptional regulator